ncbi:hypothetical protein BABINDRAFT_162879 [Babjeviella inositovora NRRL Y-12698]|uniref:HMA domain-containing protein n=1 Tax=Babjeviella inositovora NRRL Y-12698 TaxID=984486 RepID=A0A1E3QL70_9ASCO|nr:uncharacterized protein BABINDRAFT_162879 [Babjeviella inositovora NRRL Y-12698]ODQ78214.1 hypothetical protein BABINDRAFT_162879 [Babjeviella inositovora NRRL Y-12698]
MTCGACVASITSTLESIPSVKEASISLITETGTVKYTLPLTANQIKEAIEDCGFDCDIVETKDEDVHESTFTVEGMTCGACVSALTTRLEATEGVITANVSLLASTAVIQHGSSVLMQTLAAAISDCGYETRLVVSDKHSRSHTVSPDLFHTEKDLSLKVFGMTCASCTSSVESVVAALAGIKSIAVSLATEEAAIVYDEAVIGARNIVDAIADAGFKATLSSSLDNSAQVSLLLKIKDIQFWKAMCWKLGLMGLPVFFLDNVMHILGLNLNLQLVPGLYLETVVEFVLTTIIQFVLGRKYYMSAYKGLKHGLATMDLLVVISTTISYAFSLFSTAVSWAKQSQTPPMVLFSTSAMLFFFISIGKLLETMAKGETSTVLSQLLSLQPGTCTIVEDAVGYNSQLLTLGENAVQSPRQSLLGNSLIDDVKLGNGEASGNFLGDSSGEAASEIISAPSGPEQPDRMEFSNFRTREIPIGLIQLSDIAIVLPGSKIPADGVVVFGESEVDESLLTGESLPVVKKYGAQLIAGAVNGPHLLHMRVTASGNKTQLNQIVELVKNAQTTKAPVQKYADYIAGRFVPMVLCLAVLTLAYWTWYAYTHDVVAPETMAYMFGVNAPNGRFFSCLRLAISVVVVACPCALGLAAPTAVMVGTGVGAAHGILIKGGSVLEKVQGINTVIFDKTGTLTTGKFQVGNYRFAASLEKLAETDWWYMYGALESSSEHPVGRALMTAAKEHLQMGDDDVFDKCTMKNVETVLGIGIKASVMLHDQAYDVQIGSSRLLDSVRPKLSSDALREIVAHETATRAYMIVNRHYAGYVELIDSVKEDSADVIRYLKASGFRVAMITGDNRKSALRIAHLVGIPAPNVFAEVSPQGKALFISDLQATVGANVAFVGDGINDAPALVTADIGISISSGTDIAVDAADVVLITHGDVLLGIPAALSIARATFNRIRLNFLWAVVYNCVMLPVAMGFFLKWGVTLPPMGAAAAMALSSVSVVISSLLLKKWQPPVIEEGTAKEMEEFKDLEDPISGLRVQAGLWSRLRGAFEKRAKENSYELLTRG